MPLFLRRALPLIALSFTSLTASSAQADELELDWRGRLQHDLYFRVEPVGVGGFYKRLELPAGVERSQSTAGFKLDASSDLLRNPADARDWNSSPMKAGERRGTSDRFMLRFVKP